MRPAASALVGRCAKIDTSASTIIGTVGLLPNGGGGFQLTVAPHGTLPGVEHAIAERLVAQAHDVCPESNAVRGATSMCSSWSSRGRVLRLRVLRNPDAQ